jgi:hypothetical protein
MVIIKIAENPKQLGCKKCCYMIYIPSRGRRGKMHRREMEKIAVQCLLELEAMDFCVEVVSDVCEAQKRLAAYKGGEGSALDANNLLLTGANVFWVFASRSGETILSSGVRVDDLGLEDAQSFLRRSIQVIFGVKVIGVRHCVFGGRRWGRAAYFGGLVSHTAKGLSREGRRAMELLAAYTQHCAFVDLGADVSYSFHRGADRHRGITYGFLRADPFLWETDKPMYADGNPEWVMQLSKEDLPSVLAHASRLFKYSLAKDN